MVLLARPSPAARECSGASQRCHGMLGGMDVRMLSVAPLHCSRSDPRVCPRCCLLRQLPPVAMSLWIWPIYLQENGLCVSREISCCCRITQGSVLPYPISLVKG